MALAFVLFLFSPLALSGVGELSLSSLMHEGAGDVPESLENYRTAQDYCTLARRVHALYCFQDLRRIRDFRM